MDNKVKIYYDKNKKNQSCRKVIAWMEEHDTPYVIREVSETPITKEELYHILSMCDDGVDNILSKHAKAYKDLIADGIDFDELTINELLYVVERHPGILKYPITANDDVLMIGHGEDLIDAFMPREERKKRLEKMLEELRMNEDHEVIHLKKNYTDYSKHEHTFVS